MQQAQNMSHLVRRRGAISHDRAFKGKHLLMHHIIVVLKVSSYSSAMRLK